MSLLEVNDIHVYYGAIHAIKGISFSVDEGEVVTLIGANGAGKSTTLNTVAGLLRPREGSIHFGGKDLARVHASDMVKHGMALCPEGRRIFQQMTVLENLEMGGFTRPDKEIPGSIEQMFELFPRLKERQKQIAGTLSGGEQQMLAMARALMSKPRLLMLDEPSMGLAPILVEQIFDIIRALHKSGTTILLVEQNAQMALSVANPRMCWKRARFPCPATRRSCCTTMQSGRRIWGRNARQPGRWQKPASRFFFRVKFDIILQVWYCIGEMNVIRQQEASA